MLVKYSNRKIYDRTKSKYVTFIDIETDIKNCRDVQIVDNATGKDVTKEVLLSLIGNRLDTKMKLEDIIEIVENLW